MPSHSVPQPSPQPAPLSSSYHVALAAPPVPPSPASRATMRATPPQRRAEMATVYTAPISLEAVDVARLRSEIERLAQTPNDLVIDLACTEAIDGSGIGALAYMYKRLAARGHRLTVRNAVGQPLGVLRATGMLRSLAPPTARTLGGLIAGLSGWAWSNRTPGRRVQPGIATRASAERAHGAA